MSWAEDQHGDLLLVAMRATSSTISLFAAEIEVVGGAAPSSRK